MQTRDHKRAPDGFISIRVALGFPLPLVGSCGLSPLDNNASGWQVGAAEASDSEWPVGRTDSSQQVGIGIGIGIGVDQVGDERPRDRAAERERERATGNSRRPRQQTWTSEYNKVVSSSIRLPRNLPASRPAPLPPPTLPLPLPADKWADEREEWGRQPVASCAHGAGALRPERQRGLRRRLAIAH